MFKERDEIFEAIRRLHLEAERRFYDLFIEARRVLSPRGWRPPADVFETERAMVIRLEIPGTSLEDVKITLSEGTLTVSGVKRDEYRGGERLFHQAEITYGEFERSFSIPWRVSEKDIRAVYRNGVLTITLHKPAPKEVKVAVQREEEDE